MQRLEPLKFKPVYQDYVWGGDRIQKRYVRTGTPIPCAESWEIADRPEGMSIVSEGRFADSSLRDLVVMYGEKLLGRGRREGRFPLIVKLIDAKEALSVQVHPSEESSERFGGEPKTEAWHMLEGGPLYASFRHPSSKEELLAAVHEERAQELLQKIDAKPGDTLYIPGGRLHAIGPGCLILEVQQNSNSTFRVYDWGRKGRALHLKEACRFIKFDDTANPLTSPLFVEESDSFRRFSLLETLFFSIEKMELARELRIECDINTFQVFFDLKRGETILLPADSEPLDLPIGAYLRITI